MWVSVLANRQVLHAKQLDRTQAIAPHRCWRQQWRWRWRCNKRLLLLLLRRDRANWRWRACDHQGLLLIRCLLLSASWRCRQRQRQSWDGILRWRGLLLLNFHGYRPVRSLTTSLGQA